MSKKIRDYEHPCPWCNSPAEIVSDQGNIFISCIDCEFELELDTQDLIENWKKADRGEIPKEDMAANKIFQAILREYGFAPEDHRYALYINCCPVVIKVDTFPYEFEMFNDDDEVVENETWRTPSELLSFLEEHLRLD